MSNICHLRINFGTLCQVYTYVQLIDYCCMNGTRNVLTGRAVIVVLQVELQTMCQQQVDTILNAPVL